MLKGVPSLFLTQVTPSTVAYSGMKVWVSGSELAFLLAGWKALTHMHAAAPLLTEPRCPGPGAWGASPCNICVLPCNWRCVSGHLEVIDPLLLAGQYPDQDWPLTFFFALVLNADNVVGPVHPWKISFTRWELPQMCSKPGWGRPRAGKKRGSRLLDDPDGLRVALWGLRTFDRDPCH